MLVKSVAAISSLALATHAYLLPPTLPDLSVDLSGNFHLNGIEHKSHVVSVSCADCHVLSDRLPPDNSAKLTLAEPLHLNFSVAQGDPETLNINDVPIYPISLSPDMANRLPQVEIEAAQTGNQMTVPLGYSVKWTVDMSTPNTAETIITLVFRILEIADLPVTGVDYVEVTFLRTADNHLEIINARVAQSAQNHGAGHIGKGVGKAKECSLSPALCKLRAIVAGKLANLRKPGKGCHRGRRPGKVGSEETSMRYPAGDDSVHSIHRGRHGHHHGQSHAHNIIKKTALHVLLPIFIGIAAGMTASLLGMVIGHLVVALWRRFYRGEQSASYVIISESDDDVLGDEKIPFEDEDLPEYDEAVAVVTVEKQ